MVAALAATACEGPEGPAGPAGPAGPQGPVGLPGQDAAAGCQDCHVADVTMAEKQAQYETSTHLLGGHFERSSASCAACHTHQGFVDRIAAGTMTASEDIATPLPIDCRTCHQIHTTYSSADYALRTTSPVTLFNTDYETGNPITVDYGAAAGNLCAQCHQGRPLADRVAGGVLPVIGGADVEVTSSRFGLHHGPQAQVVGGVGAYEFPGSKTISGGPSAHGDPSENEKLCATCHMAESTAGYELGGHTWRVSFDNNGVREPNVAGCNTCHNGFEDFTEFGNVPAQIQGLLVQIEQILVDAGFKREMTPGYTFHELSVQVNTGVWPANLVAAMLNWQMFAEDRSLGLHNPPYARAVLENTLETISP
jgi:formate-dependent nitrite reductase cytochrome c552 subunit